MNNILKGLKELKIKGLGPKYLELLSEMRIETLYDLLYNLPRAYEDRGALRNIDSLVVDEIASVKGKIVSSSLLKLRGGRSLFKATIADEAATLELVWFQMPYLRNVITKGKEITVVGKVKSDYGLKMVNPEYNFDKSMDGIFPIYPLIKGVGQNAIRKIMAEAIKGYVDDFTEILPEEVVSKYKLMGRSEALRKIHLPTSSKDVEDAKRRFAVEELLLLQLGLMSRRYQIGDVDKPLYKLENNKELVKKFLSSLPFELTRAQKKVIAEIHRDIKNGKVVNRLLQGDVGAGKTIVAFTLLLYMIENGYQAAIMAPTEIVANQHFKNAVKLMGSLGIKIALMTGSTKLNEKMDILKKVLSGEINFLIGTHALICDHVVFKNLGMIVIDEQHKFGVNQRSKIKDKGVIANLITMSATPIPRSLALTLYGDLDISIIDELPPGRERITTKVIDATMLERMHKFIKERLDNGEQCYIVCPLIESSEKLSAKAAEEVYRELHDGFYSKYSIDLLHGRMKASERDLVIQKFKEKRTNLLVSTTVIEVGVDIPNASIMVIMNSEKFGLAQLHQMRGRVGRGNLKSYCFLVNYSQNEDAINRLAVLEKTGDGFKIAEEDLKIRRTGELFGTKQSGFSDLRFLEAIRDTKALQLAREEAKEYLRKTKGLIENRELEEEIKRKFKNFENMN